MHPVGAPDRRGAGLGQRDEARLALLHQSRHGPHRLLDWDVGVHPGQAEYVQALDVQAPQAVLAHPREVLRRPSASDPARVGRPGAAGLRVDNHTLPAALQGPGDEVVVVTVAVARRRIEKVDAQVDGHVNRGHRLVIVDAPLRAGHAHAAQTQGRNRQVRRPKLAVLHCPFLSNLLRRLAVTLVCSSKARVDRTWPQQLPHPRTPHRHSREGVNPGAAQRGPPAPLMVRRSIPITQSTPKTAVLVGRRLGGSQLRRLRIAPIGAAHQTNELAPDGLVSGFESS